MTDLRRALCMGLALLVGLQAARPCCAFMQMGVTATAQEAAAAGCSGGCCVSEACKQHSGPLEQHVPVPASECPFCSSPVFVSEVDTLQCRQQTVVSAIVALSQLTFVEILALTADSRLLYIGLRQPPCSAARMLERLQL